ncbi:MAG TPA: (d)CMP kinase [Actinocrinis sp.]|uniref:(d)CMP kinase n=1 Tax=Actinocrinis sp. TaxID=1920516 RepID=UPI002DDD002B|nr:(d)CMP kinase [Actinocrinis sp.]HEV3168990.1 (d)CMP kinase [Actinocrinis sp.]
MGVADRAIVVALDGPSGSGKSSVSRGAAARLGLRYLDTGAQYRAMTWWMLQAGVDIADPAAVAAASAKPRVESGTDPADPAICVDGEDVAVAVRSARVTASVSAVAAVQPVRDRLITLQREIIRAALADGIGIVVEGRDIADVVWPQAQCKVYLTASAEARAARRSAELADVAADTLAALSRRDAEDAKTTRPLDAAPGAVLVDATNLTLAQAIDRVVDLAQAGR